MESCPRWRTRPARAPHATIGPAEQGAFEITCTGGAQGKCVSFGYAPWGAPEGTPGFDLYNACVRMVRADYAGDGKGTTRDGQPIDLYDRFGIQRPDNDPGMELEAGWGRDGAVCVRHVRVKENVTLKALEQLSLHCMAAPARSAPRSCPPPTGRCCSIARPRDAQELQARQVLFEPFDDVVDRLPSSTWATEKGSPLKYRGGVPGPGGLPWPSSIDFFHPSAGPPTPLDRRGRVRRARRSRSGCCRLSRLPDASWTHPSPVD